MSENLTVLETKRPRKGGRPKKAPIAPVTEGFSAYVPQCAYFCVPAPFLDACAMIDNLAELKVVLYIMRHTWGFKEYNVPKHITVDEFMHGRKKIDGTRMDSGTGLSKSAVLDGLDRALKHGFIECRIDDHDRARVKHYYQLKIRNEEPTEPEPPNRFDETTNFDQTEQLEPDCQQDYDPYAGTIFAQTPVTAEPQEQKIFVSEPKLTTPNMVVDNPLGGASQIQRSKNRTQEVTLRTKEIRIAHSSEILEEVVRYLPAPDQLPQAKPKAPAFLRNMIDDFSRDLGDHEHIASNISQANRLYQDAGMDPGAFQEALYEARATAKRATKIRHLNSQGRPNRMPYFFHCLSTSLKHEMAVS
jgi:hypothetical protein